LGQYFTPPQVIDLINAFCIRKGDEKVLDPSWGAGTFVVRVYERKKKLSGKTHAEVLEEIYGIHISPYAVEFATLNLALRDLRYPKAHPKVF
jgi:type I restriction-modification system DNA methylase subunit